MDSIRAYVHKVYTMIDNRSLTMITTCSEVVNFNYVATDVTLAWSEQLHYNWHMTLMRTIMPCVRLGKGPQHLELATFL